MAHYTRTSMGVPLLLSTVHKITQLVTSNIARAVKVAAGLFTGHLLYCIVSNVDCITPNALESKCKEAVEAYPVIWLDELRKPREPFSG
jgi:hypothetical protein